MGTATLTIDLGAIRANWRALNAASADGVETAACVKADGYGLGSAKVARALAQEGCRTFCVAVAEEGAALREVLGPEPEIFVFGGHMRGDTDMIHDLGLVPMLNSIEQLTRQLEALPGAPFGVQLDSGMNRLGMEPGEWAAVRDIVMASGPRIVMSHLACADEPDHPMNAQQAQAFSEMVDGTGARLSLAATGGVLLGADYHYHLTRPGIGLYGGLPFADARSVVTLSLPVIQVRDIATGESVGYGNTWVATRPSRIATISGGYADGLIRAIGSGLNLYHEDTPCPIVGRVSMDLITVDVTDLAGDPSHLDILNEVQTVDVVAEAAGTIGYEVLTSLGARYARRFIGA